MADKKQETPWPVPTFYFLVTIGDIGKVTFQEVTGLDAQPDDIEYHADNSQIFSTVKMPGLKKTTDITLKKGVFKEDSKLMEYFQDIKMSVIKRENVVIQLLDRDHKLKISWTLKNAWPMQLSAPDLNAESSEIAVETLILAHEGITFAMV